MSMFDEALPRGEIDGVGIRVGAIIDRGGEILLLEPHSTGPIRPTCKLPGATVAPGESVTQAVLRGVFEETGLTVTRIADHIGDFDYLSPAGKPVRRLHFAVEVAATAPIALSAHAGYLWASLDGDLHVTSSIRKILDTYRETVRN
ncbi:NUDIX hydrolase [Nocardia paucivorans]|uniref:NUDIX hydrolase n=1 Tax=Nocardia paucivorans TaxID=114259 RepID=UPI0009FD20E2|nr:NUDIX hydrolase [Nocardia paucivorans]